MSVATIVALGGLVALLAGLALYERGRTGAREIGLVAVLIAAASAGRVLFAALPGAQPVTAIAIIAGVSLGPRAGIAVGARLNAEIRLRRPNRAGRVRRASG